MDKNRVLIELAGIARRSPSAALWMLGYLSQLADGDVLQEVLEGAREVEEAWRPRPVGHLAAYRERWGRLPDQS